MGKITVEIDMDRSLFDLACERANDEGVSVDEIIEQIVATALQGDEE